MSHQRSISLASVLATVCLLSACTLNPPQTGLNDRATHTGTVTLLRVDDAWHANESERGAYHVGDGLKGARSRFVPLRYIGDIAGLDGPERIVTSDDYISLTLKSGFIKYFREAGCRSVTATNPESCKGEIAIILSFDDGHEVKENLLIYSSQGQTLGSPLALDDWPVIGPVKLKGDSLLVRMIMIELDQVENERASQLVDALSTVGVTLQPELGPAFKISSDVVNFLIGLNVDDVITDTRFSLQRVDTGSYAPRNALLYGKYVLVQQEDALAGGDVAIVSPQSLNAVSIADMRYDEHSDRLFKVYPYATAPGAADTAFDASPDEWTSFSFSASCSDEAFIDNSTQAQALRAGSLGFSTAASIFREADVWANQDDAFLIAALEACRGVSSQGLNFEDLTPDNCFDAYDYTAALEAKCSTYGADAKGSFRLDYRTVDYPGASVLLAEYPLHSHLVFSVERTIERATRYDQQFAQFDAFLAEEIQAVKADAKIVEVARRMQEIRDALDNQTQLLRRVSQLGPSNPDEPKALRKVCMLWSEGLARGEETADIFKMSAPIYNEIYHVSGRRFSSKAAVAEHMDSLWPLRTHRYRTYGLQLRMT